MARTGHLSAIACQLVCAITLFVVGCGGQRKEAASANSAETQEKESPPPQAALPPLVPVDAPPGVVVRFRLAHPAKTADGLFEAMSLPFSLDDLKLFKKESVYVQAVDLNAAMEGALVLNPREPAQPLRFFSLGAKSVDVVLDALEKKAIATEEAPGGVFHFRIESQPCAVGRSLGNSPARIVCSDQRSALRDLIDYALRGLPAERLSESDGYLQADLRPIRSRYEKELQRVELLASVGARQLHVGHPKFDRAVTDAAIGLAEELSDLLLDTQLIELELDEKGGDFRTSFKLHFTAERSAVVRTLREHEQKQGPAPKIFRGLPASAKSASYSREISSERAEPWMSVLADLATGWAEHRGASAEFSEHLSRFVRSLGPHGHESVSAIGPPITVTKDGESRLVRSWSVLGTTQSKDQIVQTFDDLCWLLDSKDLAKVTQETEYTPKLERVQAKIPGSRDAVVYRWKLPKKASELKGELDDENMGWSSGTSAADIVDELMDGHIAVFSHDEKTWITWSTEGSPKDMGGVVSAITKPAKTLGQVASFNKVIETPALAAGFSQIDGIASMVGWALPSEIAKDWDGLVRATPGKGQALSTFAARVKSRGTETELAYEIRVPRAFSRDLATLVVMIVAEMDVK